MATFVNSYPTLDVSPELVKEDYTAGSPIVLKVVLSCDIEDGTGMMNRSLSHHSDNDSICSKNGKLGLIIREPMTQQLLVIKKVSFSQSLCVKLKFTLPKGKHSFKLFIQILLWTSRMKII